MCPKLAERREEHGETLLNECVKEKSLSSLMSLVKCPNVLVQTSKLNARGSVKWMSVTALIDTGSERSYILREKIFFSRQLRDKIEFENLCKIKKL